MSKKRNPKNLVRYSPFQRRWFWLWVSIGHRSGCMHWEGRRDQHGYGKVRGIDPFVQAAYVISWQMSSGIPVPAKHVVRHLCNNKACVNPGHLTLGTKADNLVDRSDWWNWSRGTYWGDVQAPPGHDPLPADLVPKRFRTDEGWFYEEVPGSCGDPKHSGGAVRKPMPRPPLAGGPNILDII